MRTISVPLDGSELAERAIGPARQIANARSATILLLQVVDQQGPAEWAAEQSGMERAGAYLAGVADRLRREGASVLVETCSGRPAEQIVAQATLWRSDMIVMATHGRGGLDELLHGSVADAVVRSADRPVLLVPARGGPRTEIAGDTIVVPVDGSVFSEGALEQAAELARELTIPLTILHAVWYMPSMVEGLAPGYGRIERMTGDGRVYVEHLARQLRAAGIEVCCEVAVGPTVGTIRKRADDLRAAMIVMATHGRGTMGRLALGSVAHEVLTNTCHPILMVRPAAATAGGGAYAPRFEGAA